MAPSFGKLVPKWMRPIIQDLGEVCRTLDLVDGFSGRGEMGRAFHVKDWSVANFDAKDGIDITTYTGFVCVCGMVMALKEGGLLWVGPECRLFIFFSSSVHARNKTNRWGNVANPDVERANLEAILTAALIRLAASRHVRIVLEQPGNSQQPSVPPMELALSLAGTEKVLTCLGSFNGNPEGPFCPIDKELQLHGNVPFLTLLRRARPKRDGKHEHECYKVNAAGVSGGKDLAATAAYTREFCELVEACYARSLPRIRREIAKAKLHGCLRDECEWESVDEACGEMLFFYS
eukprot:CAMPEP_0197654814 /NCGR_PEP_ID=MMETSP1338-20131121/39076_1 /TAXON_ID=43686 ORGANISM="Pelagodinium beii, Strain RCC1491" /NCGR_SAMPLE_ID=MMETSP1338 /ASSEMBLY_ACC=CAM_ASM_000754 /LENGTH=290 /DNA_ID=CAMNT_0043230329 /DNA_START=32 /DNA_END=904 /DNA_ORIENTATION=+